MMLNDDDLADEFDAILNYRTTHEDLVLSGGLYFDASAAGGGDGSFASPYNDLTALALLTGDQGGLVAYLKKGETFVAPLKLDNCSNLTVSAYGVGANPIISNLTTVNSANWQSDAQQDTYYMTFANMGNAGDVMVMFSSGGTDYPCYKRDSLADLLLVYERAQDGANHPWTYFYDTGASRMYVHVDPTVAVDLTAVRALTTKRPRTNSEETVAAGNHAIVLSTTDNITIIDVDAVGGRSSNVAGNNSTNTTLYGVRSYYTGNLKNTGENCFNFTGPSRASKASGLVLRSCEARDAFGANNNGLEISFMTDVTVEDCTFADLRGNAVELWQSCANVTIQRNRFYSAYSLVKFFNQDGDNLTNHNNILIQNNLCVQRASYVNKGASGSASWTGGPGIILSDFGANAKIHSNVRAVNNTFELEDAPAFYWYHDGAANGGGDGTFTFKNNVVSLLQTVDYGATTNFEPIYYAPSSAASLATCVINYNAYQAGLDQIYAQFNNDVPAGLANIETEWDTVAGATTNEDNSVSALAADAFFVSHGTMFAGSRYLHPLADVLTMAHDADADWPDTDRIGQPRTTAAPGAYEATAYFATSLSSPVTQGSETLGPTSPAWVDTPDRMKTVGTARGDGSMVIATAFQNVAFDQASTPAFVSLSWIRATGNAGYTMNLYGDKSAGAQLWSTSYRPSAAFASATTELATDTSVGSGDAGIPQYFTNIKAVVHEILAGVNWTNGGTMRFWIESPNSGGNVYSINATATELLISNQE